ncbi:hypothetical protein [Persephonella sp.]
MEKRKEISISFFFLKFLTALIFFNGFFQSVLSKEVNFYQANKRLGNDDKSKNSIYKFFHSIYKNKPIEAGFEYQYWIPEDIGKVNLESAGLIVLNLKALNLLTFRTTLNSLRDNPTSHDKIIKQESSDKESYVSIMASIPIIPTRKFFDWNFDIEAYGQAEKFTSTLNPKEQIFYHDFNGVTYTLNSGEKRTFETNFIEFGIGVSKEETDNIFNKIYKMFIGIYYQEYQKPYTPQIRDYELYPNHIFFTKFQSYGARILVKYENDPYQKGFFGRFEGKLGRGKMKFTSSIEMNQLLNENESIWFMSGEFIGGYKKFISNKLYVKIFIGADIRIFVVGYKDSSGITIDSENATNRDTIYKGGIFLGYVL